MNGLSSPVVNLLVDATDSLLAAVEGQRTKEGHIKNVCPWTVEMIIKPQLLNQTIKKHMKEVHIYKIAINLYFQVSNIKIRYW